jgi:hypothetical protein
MDLERITRDGYALRRVLGAERKAAQHFIVTHHYGQSDGGSGYLYAAIAPDGSIAGACLIGPASSMAAERAILDPPWRVWTCKRLVCLDSCPVPESQLLWYALRQTANQIGSTFGCVSYADPVARDARTGLPLGGKVYAAANHLYIGLTSQPRYALLDEHGRMRSSRQGKVTLGRRSLPEGWHMQKIPPARVWLAVVTPEVVTDNGVARPTTRRWRKRQWRTCLQALNPKRRAAAQQWIGDAALRDAIVAGQATPIAAPTQRTENAGLQPAHYAGAQLNRTAGPVWVPFVWQDELVLEGYITDETTAHRQYAPRLHQLGQQPQST